MATIAIYTSGTLGDHLPYIALGRALTAGGHRVRMIINQAMHVYARQAGLEAFALTDIERGPEQARENAWAWDHWNHAGGGGDPNARPLDPGHFLTQAHELIELCRGADLLIATSNRTLGYVAHAALGLPWLTASMNPFTFWQAALQEERQAQNESWVRYHALFRPLLEHAFTELGIAEELPPCSRGRLFAPHVLLASSPHFSRPALSQLQPRSSIDMTGFWYYEDPDWRDWQPDEELRRFCERRPIVLTFSSQPLENPRQVLALHVEAAARLGELLGRRPAARRQSAGHPVCRFPAPRLALRPRVLRDSARGHRLYCPRAAAGLPAADRAVRQRPALQCQPSGEPRRRRGHAPFQVNRGRPGAGAMPRRPDGRMPAAGRGSGRPDAH